MDDPIALFAALRLRNKVPPLPDDAIFIGFMNNILPQYQRLVEDETFLGYATYVPLSENARRMPRNWVYGKWTISTKLRPNSWLLAARYK